MANVNKNRWSNERWHIHLYSFVTFSFFHSFYENVATNGNIFLFQCSVIFVFFLCKCLKQIFKMFIIYALLLSALSLTFTDAGKKENWPIIDKCSELICIVGSSNAQQSKPCIQITVNNKFLRWNSLNMVIFWYCFIRR